MQSFDKIYKAIIFESSTGPWMNGQTELYKNIAKKAAELNKEGGFWCYFDCKTPLNLLSCKAKGTSSRDSKKYDYACNVRLLGFRIDTSDINNIKISIKLEFNPFRDGYGSPVGYPEVGIYEIYPEAPSKKILFFDCSQNSGFFVYFCLSGLENVFNRVEFSKPKIFEYNNFDNQIQISSSKGNFKIFQQMILNKLLEELGIDNDAPVAALPKAPEKKEDEAKTIQSIKDLAALYRSVNSDLIRHEVNGSTESKRDRFYAQLEAIKNPMLDYYEKASSENVKNAAREALRIADDCDEYRYRI